MKVSKKEDVQLSKEIQDICASLTDFMNDDFNSAQTLAALFDLSNKINGLKGGQLNISSLSEASWKMLNNTFPIFINDVLGLKTEEKDNIESIDGIIRLLISIRNSARQKKDFETSDRIRKQLTEMGIILKDDKDGTTNWSFT